MPYFLTEGLLPGYAGTGAMNPSAERTAHRDIADARSYAEQAILDRATYHKSPALAWSPFCLEARELPARGATIGPLPDGTLVEVKSTGWPALMGAGLSRGARPPLLARSEEEKREIVAAYNGH